MHLKIETSSSGNHPSVAAIPARPVVASYCAIFLKPEMLHIYRQVTGLKGFDTFVIANERECEREFPFEDLEVVPRPARHPLRYVWLKYVRHEPPLVYRGEYAMLEAIMQRRHPDLLHVYFGHMGVHLLPFIQRWPHPALVSFHGMDVQSRQNEPNYLSQLKQLLRALPLVLVRSQSLQQRLVELGCEPAKIRVNRTGIPLGHFPFVQRTPPAGNAWRIVQACRLIDKKGVDVALTAFAKFHKQHPAARYTIAGDGPLRPRLESLARELGVADAVTFLGFVSEAELKRLYSEAHLFVHPSQMTPDQNQEGIPNSMLEAMATGLPVVATRHGGIPEAVRDGVTGLLSAERDAEALAENLTKLTQAPARWLGMGCAASEDVRMNFEQRAQIAKLESFYREILNTWHRTEPHSIKGLAPQRSEPEARP
jgi:colanic acid/amylovoran biosynthesis glycosyltransferase